jgi:ubiquinone/menaquinone biosynthesis C-methylase UbiE
MSNNPSFDRAAHIYDQTRPLVEPGASRGIQAVFDIIGSDARVLDVGTGTGRISIPLLERGVDLVGCDLSAGMLRRLQEKFSGAHLARADAAWLPFPSGHFGVVLTAHVLHLISSWREALHEFRRVLKPNGTYLNLKTWEPVGTSVRTTMRDFWRGWLLKQGIDARLAGARGNEELLSELKSLGAHLTEVDVIHYPLKFTLREELERLASRVASDTWDIPDAIFDASLKELEAWAAQEYGDLDGVFQDELRFAIDVAHFKEAANLHGTPSEFV